MIRREYGVAKCNVITSNTSFLTFVTVPFLPYNGNDCSNLVRQEQELRNGGTVDKKLSTLADLFRPPIELMHKGSFETVRVPGRSLSSL